MNNIVAARHPMLPTGIAVVAVAASCLAPITALPAPQLRHQPTRHNISSQAVALADNWSNFFDGARIELQLLELSANAGLPAVSNPVAPIAEQALINVATYVGQLVTGQGGKIPGEIAAHIGNLVTGIKSVAGLTLLAAGAAALAVVTSVGATLNFIQTHNPLESLIEAPAYLASLALTVTAEFIGVTLQVRNGIARAIDPPLPKWLSWLAPSAPTANNTPVPVSTSSTPTSAKAPLTVKHLATPKPTAATGIRKTATPAAGKSKTPAAVNNSPSESPKQDPSHKHGSPAQNSGKHAGPA